MLDKCDLEDDWHPYAGRCYKYFTNDATWSDARTACANKGASLAILNTNEKLDVFKEVVSCKDYDSGIWIGLSDKVGLSQLFSPNIWTVQCKLFLNVYL